MTIYILLAFVVGLILLIFGIIYSKRRALKIVLLIAGCILLVVSVAMGLFLVFVLIPAMDMKTW